MSILLRQLARYVAQKVASDPATRDKVLRAAGDVVREAGKTSNRGNRAYAAGKAVRRAIDKLHNDK